MLSLRLRKANVLPFGVVPMTRLRLSSSPLKLPNWVKTKHQHIEEERRAAEVSKRLRELREGESAIKREIPTS